ncbi:MAG: hypothetical protein ACRC2T_12520, partial [Thermoguttaceae bacterium]
MKRLNFYLSAIFVAALFVQASSSCKAAEESKTSEKTRETVSKNADKQAEKPFRFFALCMDSADEKKRTISEQGEMLQEVGFDGVANLWLDGLEERIESCKQNGLKLEQIYFNVDLNAAESFDARLAEKMSAVKKLNTDKKKPYATQTQLAVLIGGGKPSDSALDDKAVEIL